jgi:hypothetical protein
MKRQKKDINQFYLHLLHLVHLPSRIPEQSPERWMIHRQQLASAAARTRWSSVLSPVHRAIIPVWKVKSVWKKLNQELRTISLLEELRVAQIAMVKVVGSLLVLNLPSFASTTTTNTVSNGFVVAPVELHTI